MAIKDVRLNVTILFIFGFLIITSCLYNSIYPGHYRNILVYPDNVPPTIVIVNKTGHSECQFVFDPLFFYMDHNCTDIMKIDLLASLHNFTVNTNVDKKKGPLGLKAYFLHYKYLGTKPEDRWHNEPIWFKSAIELLIFSQLLLLLTILYPSFAYTFQFFYLFIILNSFSTLIINYELELL